MKSFLGYLKAENMSVFTDFYELTMCASYFDNKNFEPATFDLFIRRLPENRSYFLFAGLEEALHYLKSVKFTDEQLTYLKKQGFNQEFLVIYAPFILLAKFGLLPREQSLFQTNR